jgi:hypothetical protein
VENIEVLLQSGRIADFTVGVASLKKVAAKDLKDLPQVILLLK